MFKYIVKGEEHKLLVDQSTKKYLTIESSNVLLLSVKIKNMFFGKF